MNPKLTDHLSGSQALALMPACVSFLPKLTMTLSQSFVRPTRATLPNLPPWSAVVPSPPSHLDPPHPCQGSQFETPQAAPPATFCRTVPGPHFPAPLGSQEPKLTGVCLRPPFWQDRSPGPHPTHWGSQEPGPQAVPLATHLAGPVTWAPPHPLQGTTGGNSACTLACTGQMWTHPTPGVSGPKPRCVPLATLAG